MSSTPKKSLKIFINSIEATGHQNACIGIGQALIKRGHKVFYLISEAFRGQMEKYGFEEIVFANESKDTASSEEKAESENPIKAIAEFLLSSGLLGPANSLEKMKVMSNEAFVKDVYDKTIAQSGQMRDAIERVKPDLFIQDHFMIQPVILRANIPYVMLFSGCPLYLYNEPSKIPPSCSGYSTSSDPSTWTEFNTVFQRDYIPIIRKYQKMLYEHFEYEPPQETEEEKKRNFPLSPYLNIYGYPKELDFQDIVQMPKIFTQLDAFCRDETKSFTLPENFVKPGEKLIYVSMGSMGSIDVELMKRLLSMLSKSPHKFIVSKGQRHDEYELPENCWGEAHLPQTAILPLVDLVITHGGNNSFTESFTFGKPMIVMPLFADQYDNAQRIVDKGFGVQFEPYTCEESDLIEAIDRLLGDSALQERLRNISNRIKKDNSKEKACEIIENLVE